MALCMSVNPGWGNQQFIPWSLDKLARMRGALPDHVALEVDGGVHEATAGPCVEAGANLLVTGSAVFGSADPGRRVRRDRRRGRRGLTRHRRVRVEHRNSDPPLA